MCYYFFVERKKLFKKIFTKARKLARKLSKKAIKKFKQAAKKVVLAAKNVAKLAKAAVKQAVTDIKKVVKNAGKIAAIVTSGGFKECVSAAVDFIPVVGNIKSGVEAITGYDPITGRKLEPWERAVSTVGILGGPAAKAVKHGGKLAVKGGKFLQQQGSKLAQQGGKLVEMGGNLLGKVADVLDSSRTQLAGVGAGLGKFSLSTGISAGKKATGTAATTGFKTGKSGNNNINLTSIKNAKNIKNCNKEQLETIQQVESGKIKLTNSKVKGNYGEMKMDVLFESNEYRRISIDRRVTSLDDKLAKGIDGVYENPNPPPYITISESKYNSAKLKYTNNPPQKQMSWEWIDARLNKAVGIEKAKEIRKLYRRNPDNIEFALINVKENGDMIYHSLNEKGNKIYKRVIK